MIGIPDNPEDALAEASAQRGGGGGEQEGRAVPPHPERAGRGEGVQRTSAETADGAKPADKVHTHGCFNRSNAHSLTPTCCSYSYN